MRTGPVSQPKHRSGILIVGVTIVLIAGLALGYRYMRRSYDYEAAYSTLEQQRAEQRAVSSAPATPSPAPATLAAIPAATSSTTTATMLPADYWTDFRGPKRDGSYTERVIRTEWPANLQPMWKQPIGGGYASFAVGAGRAYTIEQRRNREVVAAYDIETGRELWTTSWPAEFRESMGGDGPRATPTYHDGRLYALGAKGEFRCLDAATGAQQWRRDILDEARVSNVQWGMAASPLIVDDKVIVQPGGRGASIVAYQRTTGAPVWKTLDDQASYTSPMLVTIAGRRQILTVTATRVVGLAPDDGALLWDFPWENSARINVAQPILVNDHRIFMSAAYGAGAVVFDVMAAGSLFTTRQIWANSFMKNRFQTSVLSNGYVYGLDEGILSCLEVNTGERKWKGGRYGYGQVLLAGDRLIVLTEDGELVLVSATPDNFTELARIQALDGRSWNVPAFANGRLLIRNATEMAAYDLAK